MKCDKLQARKANDFSANWGGEWYRKTDVDEAIAEIKAENERLNGLLNVWNTYKILGDTNKKLRATRRALWLARAERAHKEVILFRDFSCLVGKEFKWRKIEKLCRAKAEEYK